MRRRGLCLLIVSLLAGCASPGPGITADPDYVAAGSSLATTNIHWTTGDGTWGQVFVSDNGQPERLYVQGPQGSAVAPWIGIGRYDFRLYEGQDHQRLLASVTVVGYDQPAPSDAGGSGPRRATAFTLIGIAAAFVSLLALAGYLHRNGRPRLAAETAVVIVLAGTVLAFWYRVLLIDGASIPYDIQEWHYPQLAFLAHALARGDLPLWNPHVYGGMSFAGEINAAIFYPINLAILWIGGRLYDGIPYRLIEILLAMHYVLAGWTAYALARSFAVRRPAAAAAGIIYTAGPYLASQAQHFGLVIGAAWVPLALLAARRSVERPGLVWPTLFGVILATTILTGFFPATMALAATLIAIHIWAIGRAAAAPDGAPGASRIALRAAWAAALALGLAAVQLWPFVELGTASIAVERHMTRVIGPPLATAMTTVVPQFFNVRSPANYWAAADLTQGHFYLPPFVLTLAVIGAVLSRRRDAIWLLAAALTALLIASREITTVVPFLTRLPVTILGAFELFTFRLFYDLGLALLAAIGLDVLWTRRDRPAAGLKRVGLATLAVLAAVLIGIMVHASRWLTASAIDGRVSAVADNARVMLGSALEALIWVIVTALGLWVITVALARRKRLFDSMAAAVAFTLIVVPLCMYGSNQRFNTESVAADFKLGPTYEIGGRTGVVAFLQQQRNESAAFRIEHSGAMGWRWAMASQLWALDNIHGDDPLLPADTYAFLAGFSSTQRLKRLFTGVDLNSPLLNLMNVRFVVASSADQVEHDLRPLDADVPAGQFSLVFSDWYKVFENRAALPRAVVVPKAQVLPDRAQILAALASGAIDPLDTVLLEEPAPPLPHDAQLAAQTSDAPSTQYTPFGPDRIRVEVRGSPGGILLVLDPFWPGWVASIDGTPARILRANYLFRAVPLPPGDHVVDMRYEPRSVRLGGMITAAAVLVAVAVLASTGWRYRTRTTRARATPS